MSLIIIYVKNYATNYYLCQKFIPLRQEELRLRFIELLTYAISVYLITEIQLIHKYLL